MAADDAQLLQPADTRQAGRWRQMYPFRQLHIAELGVFLEQFQDIDVRLIQVVVRHS
jgi:hypothetical protein